MLGELDTTEEITYAAVGLALSRWEELEIVLADLYSFFVGQPIAAAVIRQFRKPARIFTERVRDLECSASAFFVRLPNQPHEGELSSIVAGSEAASLTRNRIAHGLVQMVQLEIRDQLGRNGSQTGYLLCAPAYASTRLRMSWGDGLGSAEIERLSDEFVVLKERATALLNGLIRSTH